MRNAESGIRNSKRSKSQNQNHPASAGKKGNMNTLNETQVRLFASPNTWMADEALRQLYAAAKLEGVRLAVGFPDLHSGKSGPVGAAFVIEGFIYPHLIGGDIGCGMALFKTDLLQLLDIVLVNQDRHDLAILPVEPCLDPADVGFIGIAHHSPIEGRVELRDRADCLRPALDARLHPDLSLDHAFRPVSREPQYLVSSP